MSSTNPFHDFIKLYRNDPVKFVHEVLGIEPLPYQAELLKAVASSERKCSVRSGHGTGKSSTASWLMLWYLLTRLPVKVLVTAPSSAQLDTALMAETKANINKLPATLKSLLTVKSDRIELTAAPSEAFISARVSRPETPEALAGAHVSGPNSGIMLIADEASGCSEAVFEAASGSMSTKQACTLLFSNPTRSSGFFFDTHNTQSHNWWTAKWSCVDSPLVAEEFVEEMKDRYGEESNAFKIRVMGDFPVTDNDTIVPFHLAEAASRRDIEENPSGRIIWGLDPARFGNDSAALAKRKSNTITEIKTWRGLDLMQLCGAVKAEYDALHPSDQCEVLFVDAIGIGAGVCDRLSELGLPAVGINVSESPAMKSNYTNLRAELWFKLKSFLENRDCKIPQNDKLISEMVATKYTFTSSGKAKAETKDEMKKRGLGSPDMADAVCLTLAHDNAIGIRGNFNWNKPVRRNMKGVA